MIDTHARYRARDALIRFAKGVTTNDEFEEEYPLGDAHDRALQAIRTMVWNQYDDHRAYKLVGPDAPTDATKALLDRCIAFLETELEYQWPVSDFMAVGQVGNFINALSFGAINAHLAQRRSAELHRMASAGDMRYWPFRSASELQTAGIG